MPSKNVKKGKRPRQYFDVLKAGTYVATVAVTGFMVNRAPEGSPSTSTVMARYEDERDEDAIDLALDNLKSTKTVKAALGVAVLGGILQWIRGDGGIRIKRGSRGGIRL